MALVPMSGKLTFDQDRLEWGFLMHDEAAAQDVLVFVPARTVQYIRDADTDEAKAIEDRRADIEQAASRKFDRGQFEPRVLHSLRVIEISPADLDE